MSQHSHDTGVPAKTRSHPIRSMDQATSAYAQNRLQQLTPETLLADLKRQGIGSLEDLARKTTESIQATLSAGVAFDDDLIHMCYKFTSFKPHFDINDLRQATDFAARQGG